MRPNIFFLHDQSVCLWGPILRARNWKNLNLKQFHSNMRNEAQKMNNEGLAIAFS